MFNVPETVHTNNTSADSTRKQKGKTMLVKKIKTEWAYI
jgi:hypothetical protein